MNDLWTTLVPLAIGSAILPVQIAVTVLLLQSKAGRIAAVAWVVGLTAVRLGQGLIFGLVLGTGIERAGGAERPGPIASTLLLMVAVLFFVSALRYVRRQPDEEAPPPRWMSSVDSATPRRAFLLGASVVALSPKLWVFTLGAIGVIGEAALPQASSVLVFLAFVVAAESIHLAAVTMAYVVPDRAAIVLERSSEALRRHDRVIMITLGLVFGTWFALKALAGFGVV